MKGRNVDRFLTRIEFVPFLLLCNYLLVNYFQILISLWKQKRSNWIELSLHVLSWTNKISIMGIQQSSTLMRWVLCSPYLWIHPCSSGSWWEPSTNVRCTAVQTKATCRTAAGPRQSEEPSTQILWEPSWMEWACVQW